MFKPVFLRLLSAVVFVVFVFSGRVFASDTAQPSGKPLIVTSIKPLEFIVKDILGESVNVQSLLVGQASPHHFALGVAQARLLDKADLVVWVGPDLELFLSKAVAGKTHITLAAQKDVAAASSNHTHNHADNHVWLDIALVNDFATRLTRKAGEMWPAKKSGFEHSLRSFQDDLVKTDNELSKVFVPMQTVPFIVYHDAFGLLAEHYNLAQRAALTEVPDEQISARRLMQIQQTVKNDSVACLLVEEAEAPNVERMGAVLKLPVISVDILASDASLGSYREYLLKIASQITQCKS